MRISLFALTFACVVALCAASDLRAQDKSAEPASEAAAVDAFDVPDGKDADFYEERVQLVFKALSEQYSGRQLTEEDANEVFGKIRDAMRVIFNNTRKGTDEKSKQIAAVSMNYYLASLARFGNLDEISKVLDAEIESGVDPDRIEAIKSYKRELEIPKAGEEKDTATLQRIADEICEEVGKNAAQAGQAYEMAVEIARYDEAIGKATQKKIIEALQKSDNPNAKRIVSILLGKERFNNLVGNEMFFEGVWLDKSEVKWEEFKGKVVLVDFWATWCGPCLGEIPNVEKLYEKYHEAGFEVVGYSVDSDLKDLEKFEEERKLPWKTASSKLSKEAGKQDLSEYYGVNAIPTMILVGRDGKVIDTEARGAHLAELLKEQFPDVK